MQYYDSLLRINHQFYSLLAKRLKKKLEKADFRKYRDINSPKDFIENLELPIYIRSYVEQSAKRKGNDKFNISGFLDGLSFPFMGALFILSAHFAGTKTMFNSRPLLNDFSKNLGKYEQPARVLWLTDTFDDKNGVFTFLQDMHLEVKKRNLPVDIVCCHSTLKPDKHLHVLKPIQEFSLPSYTEYTFRVPDFIELHNLFLRGGYDRIICSTEGIMGFCALYLKYAYSVESSFYLHTDWITFAQKTLGLQGRSLSQTRRLFRWYYRNFDHLLVLNTEQKAWLSGPGMNIHPAKVSQTAHWVKKCFYPYPSEKNAFFNVEEDTPVLLYAGRVSKEKGVMELPGIYSAVKQKHNNVKIVVVGNGPALKDLKKELPDGIFFNWLEQDVLPYFYSSADVFILPSKFDTFSCAVLEAQSCGLPVVAYNCKGPKDIIIHAKSGFLANTQNEIKKYIVALLERNNRMSFRQEAVNRASDYKADHIINGIMKSVGMEEACEESEQYKKCYVHS